MAYLDVQFHENRCKIISQVFCCDLHDSWENRKVLFVILRSLCSPQTGKPFFSYQCLAEAFGYKARQHIHNYVREYEQCDENFFEFLRHTRKIDPVVVEAVRAALSKDILAKTDTVRVQVNQRLGREDLTSDNIRTAFDQIPCTVIRQQARRELAAGTFHPKETVVLAELFAALEQDRAGSSGRHVGEPSRHVTSGHRRETSQKERHEAVAETGESSEAETTTATLPPNAETEAGKLPRYAEHASAAGMTASHDAPDEAIIQKRQAASVGALLTPQCPVSEIPTPVAQMVKSMALYHSGASFSQLGRWFGGTSKSTMYRWVIGLALALWPVIQGWLWGRISGRRLLIDEKWIKIRKKWQYLFAAVDHDSGLPLFHTLLPSRTTWACRLFLLKLRRLGKTPSAIITDGLKGYPSAITKVFPRARHLLCVFHHQHSVPRCVKTQFSETEAQEANAIKKQMKRVMQTHDTRTVTRRLDRLESKADKKGWRKIVAWCIRTRDTLTHLLPAVRSNTLPSTTNEIERFFRAFTQFSKTRCGFQSGKSAKREIIFFMVVYLFTIQAESGKAPIETILPEANTMPFYHLLNYLFVSEITSQPLQHVKNADLAENMATELVEELA